MGAFRMGWSSDAPRRREAGRDGRVRVELALRALQISIVIVLAAGVTALAQGPTYRMGRAPSDQEVKTWDIAIGPQGKELPPGRGTAKEGAAIFEEKCATCH